MKNFLSSLLGTMTALMLAAIFLMGGLLALLRLERGTSGASNTVKPGAWMVFNLSTPLQDAPPRSEGLDELADMLGEHDDGTLQVREVTRALAAAAADPDIAGLYLPASPVEAGRSPGLGALQEVRAAIEAFRAAGKPVKARLEFAGTREMFLASAADDVVLDPFGAVVLPGLASQPVFFTGALEKLGVGVQVTRVGRYKSAIEPFIRRDMSPESREQDELLLGDLWKVVVAAIETSRRLPAGTLQSIADREGLLKADEAKASGLVDRLAYQDEVLDELREATGVKGNMAPFRQVRLADYAQLVPASDLAARRRDPGPLHQDSHQKIAIVYAEGSIVDGSGHEDGVVRGSTLARQLRALRRDSSVKAVVLRVNSPGGSVSASETIGREVRLLQKAKPVAVSMGSVAASGGYWISMGSGRIFAEPATVTGSIGVFGLLFNVKDLATDRLGLSFDTVKTARFADSATVLRPKTPEELAVVQKHVDWIYGQFLDRVAAARGLSRDAVDELAQGRVWSGKQALQLGLVDEMGGLEDALAWAAGQAKVGEEFTVLQFPHRKTLLEAIAEGLSHSRRDQSGSLGALAKVMGNGPLGRALGDAAGGLASLGEYDDPNGLYARLPFSLPLP